MDVNEAVHIAKAYVVELFAEEGVTGCGLEEVERDDATGDWRITVSISRPGSFVAPDFKVVVVREDGQIRSVKHRRFADG